MIREYKEDGKFIIEIVLGGFKGFSSSTNGIDWIGDLSFEYHNLRCCSATVTPELLIDMEERGLEQSLKDWNCISGGISFATYNKEDKKILKIYNGENVIERLEYDKILDRDTRSSLILSDGRGIVIYPFGYFYVESSELSDDEYLLPKEDELLL